MTEGDRVAERRVSRALSRAVRSGDQRGILQALQQRLARELEDASTREVPALAGRLMEVMAKLEELSAGDGPAKPAEPTSEQKLADSAARKRGRAADPKGPNI